MQLFEEGPKHPRKLRNDHSLLCNSRTNSTTSLSELFQFNDLLGVNSLHGLSSGRVVAARALLFMAQSLLNLRYHKRLLAVAV